MPQRRAAPTREIEKIIGAAFGPRLKRTEPDFRGVSHWWSGPRVADLRPWGAGRALLWRMSSLGFFLLSFPQNKVRRLLSSPVLRHRKSKSGQVETGKQCFPLTEYNG